MKKQQQGAKPLTFQFIIYLFHESFQRNPTYPVYHCILFQLQIHVYVHGM